MATWHYCLRLLIADVAMKWLPYICKGKFGNAAPVAVKCESSLISLVNFHEMPPQYLWWHQGYPLSLFHIAQARRYRWVQHNFCLTYIWKEHVSTCHENGKGQVPCSYKTSFSGKIGWLCRWQPSWVNFARASYRCWKCLFIGWMNLIVAGYLLSKEHRLDIQFIHLARANVSFLNTRCQQD